MPELPTTLRSYRRVDMKRMVWTGLATALAATIFGAGSAGASSVCGDVNDNGEVTATDALSVLRKAVGQAIVLLCAPPGQFPSTGQTTAYGTDSDGAVQIGAPRSFTDNGDGTITDNVTGLMWEKKGDSGNIHDKDNTYTWSTGDGNLNGTAVKSFLETLNSEGFAGYKDWRLPNILELQSLVDFESTSPAIYPEFSTACVAGCAETSCSCASSSYYLSSSTYRYLTANEWVVDFSDGYALSIAKTSLRRARAVRGGS